MKNYTLTFLLAVLVVLTSVMLRKSFAEATPVSGATNTLVAIGPAPMPLPPHVASIGPAPMPLPPHANAIGPAPMPLPPHVSAIGPAPMPLPPHANLQ